MLVAKRRVVVFCLTLLFCLSCAVTALASFQRGDDGQEVLSIQKRLVELNYSIKSIDGDFGPETENAVRSFQTDRGLEVDGIVGSATYRALMNKEMPPNRSNSVVRNVMRAAYSVIGTPYVFGGTTPYGFDCSGFTQYAFARAGVYLPRMADSQFYSGRQISMSQLRPGDLIFFTTYEAGASHVGIYVGNGNFIHAGTSTGYWGARYYGACRVL